MTSIDVLNQQIDLASSFEGITDKTPVIKTMKLYLRDINNIKPLAEGILKSNKLPDYTLSQIIEELKGWAMDHICVVCKKPIDESLVIYNDNNEPVHPGPCYNFAKEQPVTESGHSLNEVELLM
ncbi:hypothetical protein KNT81_gp076 [Proteus phage phiP4-3]|uniref:Uncharacterized protein n=1 Tax=Proteus phage phiP4-3 TaxID=2065203 RepID=A0A2I6PFD9_9CAUD|nr:hypothetical protein KNT81_gp076 [Proteus phage phiP4-3]AUM58434.1 hypothetical protein phiP43_076 [Proteus phage phiP4-3]QQV89537.1 hypothetical protein SJ_119 [Proteus phage SJ_PmiM]